MMAMVVRSTMMRTMVRRPMVRRPVVRLLSGSLALAWRSLEWVLEVRESPSWPWMMWTIMRVCNPGFKIKAGLVVFGGNLFGVLAFMTFHREQGIIERVACGLVAMAAVVVVTLAERLLDVVDDIAEAWDPV
jgi:hypothetical protein